MEKAAERGSGLVVVQGHAKIFVGSDCIQDVVEGGRKSDRDPCLGHHHVDHAINIYHGRLRDWDEGWVVDGKVVVGSKRRWVEVRVL